MTLKEKLKSRAELGVVEIGAIRVFAVRLPQCSQPLTEADDKAWEWWCTSHPEYDIIPIADYRRGRHKASGMFIHDATHALFAENGGFVGFSHTPIPINMTLRTAPPYAAHANDIEQTIEVGKHDIRIAAGDDELECKVNDVVSEELSGAPLAEGRIPIGWNR